MTSRREEIGYCANCIHWQVDAPPDWEPRRGGRGRGRQRPSFHDWIKYFAPSNEVPIWQELSGACCFEIVRVPTKGEFYCGHHELPVIPERFPYGQAYDLDKQMDGGSNFEYYRAEALAEKNRKLRAQLAAARKISKSRFDRLKEAEAVAAQQLQRGKSDE